MPTLDEILSEKLATLEAQTLKRTIQSTERQNGAHIIRNGKSLISFSCNDYLGLSHHPDVIKASVEASKRYGSGAGASRLITGNHPLYDEMETTLADMKGTEAACVFGSGYLANIGTVAALMDKNDMIIADKLSHACMLDAAKLSGATLKRYAHNDMAHLESLLKQRKDYKHCLIMTETVFSMDGDIAPIDQINALAKQYDSWVMSDDAHGLGIIKSPAVEIQMGTLSKAAGAYGGYVCGSQILVDTLKTSARSLIYSTGLPPATVAAANAALKIMQSEPERSESALNNAKLFCERLGLPTPQSTIVPLIIGDAANALAASQQLEEEGYLVSAIRPPTVAAGTARLRFAFSANHATSDIEQLTELIAGYGWLKHIDDKRLDATG